MSMARKLQRSKGRAKPTPMALIGFDLQKIALTDIESIEMDTTEHTVTVRFSIPTGSGENTADYEETFVVQENPDINAAATLLSHALVETVRKRSAKIQTAKLPCLTCTGNCCGRQFSSVHVTAEDVERMKEGGVDVSKDTIKFYPHELFSGHVGEFKLVPYTGPSDNDEEDETCCPHLRREGCSIYPHRPKICREYSAWTCDIYEEDPEKKSGKLRLQVITD